MSIGPLTVVPPQQSNNAASIVNSGFERQANAADSSFSTVTGFIGDLKTLAKDSGLFQFDFTDVQLGDLTNAIHAIVYPARPTLQSVDIQFPSAPVEPTLLPVTATALPDPPSSAVPAVPLAGFAWEEAAYSSPLLTGLNEILLALSQGQSTGIPPGVEAQIYQRMRDRNAPGTRAAQRQAARSFSDGGWDRPIGLQAKQEREIARDALARESEDSRSVATNQAELEQKNRQFAIATGAQHEAAKLQYEGLKQQRSLDAVKYRREEILNLFKADLSAREIAVNAYGALAEAVIKQVTLDAKVKQELPLEKYKTQAGVVVSLTQAMASRIQAISSMNESSIKMYSTEIGAEAQRVSAEAEAVKAEAQTLSAKANIAIENLKARIQLIIAEAGFDGDIAKSLAQVGAQLAASIWSSFNLGATVSDSYGASNQSQYNLSGTNTHHTEYNADK